MNNLLRHLHRIRGLSVLLRGVDFRISNKKILWMPRVSYEEKELLRKVSLSVHDNDNMYVYPNAKHYLLVGVYAIRCIETAMDKSRKKDIRSILSFPCGYGRELRFLKIRFPNAEIIGSDIDTTALQFCQREFSLKTVLSDKDFKKISLANKFDLIWSGSLVTHLDEDNSKELLRFFYNHLAPGGICVFTTHGRLSADWFEANRTAYGMSEEAGQQILSLFHKSGYGYADYKNCLGYGISVVSQERMLEMACGVGQWSEVCYLERGWDSHQDVYCFGLGAQQDQ